MGNENSKATDNNEEIKYTQNTDEQSGADDKLNEKPENANNNEEVKTFTQEEVDKIISQRLEREKKVAKKEIESDSEKIEELQSDINSMQMENYALKKGITEANLNLVLRLANTAEGDDYKQKIDSALEEIKALIKSTETNEENSKVSTGNTNSNSGVDKFQARFDAMRKRMGLDD